MKTMAMTPRGCSEPILSPGWQHPSADPPVLWPSSNFKLGVNTPETDPLTIHLTEAAKAIGAQSSGRLNVTVFANSWLGGDPEMQSQVRAGGGGGIGLLAASLPDA